MKSVTIPPSVKSIEFAAFSYCYSLSSIIIPDSVTQLSECAFRFCTGLKSVSISSSITRIEYQTFEQCRSLKSVDIPDGVTYIGEMAFLQCDSLSSLTIPNSVTDIDSRAFEGCKALENVIIPNSVKNIRGAAFSDCSSLTSITIPSGVEFIANCAFAGCTNMTSMVVEEGNTFYDSRDNCNAIIITETNTLLCGCKTTFIPVTISTINCGAFWGCSTLNTFTIPDNGTKIEDCAFAKCNSIKTLTCSSTKPSIATSGAFYEVPDSMIVYVPDSVVDAYKTHSTWKRFDIRPLSQSAIIETNESPSSRTKKLFRNGQLLIQTPLGTFTATGQQIE